MGFSGKKMPSVQYHATSWDRVPKILEHGLKTPEDPKQISTHRFETPSISTTDDPKNARVYHPSGALLEVHVAGHAKYLYRDPQRHLKRGENVEQGMNRWLKEAKSGGYHGVRIADGFHSSVGHQHIDPSVLKVHRVVNAGDEPSSVRKSLIDTMIQRVR